MKVSRIWNLFTLALMMPIFIFDGYVFYTASEYYGYKRDIIMYIMLDSMYNFILIFVVCLSTRKISQLKTDSEFGVRLIPKNKTDAIIETVLVLNIVSLILLLLVTLVYTTVFIYAMMMLCASGSIIIDSLNTSCREILYTLGAYILYHTFVMLFSAGGVISVNRTKSHRKRNSSISSL